MSTPLNRRAHQSPMDAASNAADKPKPEERRRLWGTGKAAIVFASVTLLSVALLYLNNGASLLDWPTALLPKQTAGTDQSAAGRSVEVADSPSPDGAMMNASLRGDVDGGTAFFPRDRLLGGLLSPEFDEGSCWSRYEAALYRRPSPFTPSPYLVQKLRDYEARHRRCGPGTVHYTAALEQLKSSKNSGGGAECKYVAWLPANGIGNRMLSIASTFLYALLNSRVLLVLGPVAKGEHLFCEPFPNTSWVLTPDFPFYSNSWIFGDGNPENYVNMLSAGKFRGGEALPAFVYFHLINRGSRLTGNTFCDEDHRNLEKFQWVLLRSDCFFATALFLMPMYSGELHRLFPESKEAVFHHLGRYLFHPSNKVWGMVTRYYAGYLAGADERIGIQVRVFDRFFNVSFEVMFAGIEKCVSRGELLPRTISADGHPASAPPLPKKKAVLIVSLKTDYYDKLKRRYYENATASGELVTLHQPTHEEAQQTESTTHNHRALAEIYLLSLCDKLVTTSWSTFGYTAHSLAGVRPWMMVKSECVRSGSADPCMLSIPTVSCAGGAEIRDLGRHVPYVRHCEDVGYGLKLFDQQN